jgi:folate-binding protein YgfZ
MFFLSKQNIIEISGFEDSIQIKNFLQSIISNDINFIENSSENNSIYTLFLNAGGRFLFDCFIVIAKEDGQEKIFLDCHKDFSERIISHLKKYKMRLSFVLQKRNDLFVFSDRNGSDNIFNNKILFEFKDNRSKNQSMGKRFVIQNPTDEFLQNQDDYKSYTKFRIENGILDGAFELESEISLPINFNMHSQGAISLKKGCYIGQETTNRLFRTSVLRKNIFVIKIQELKPDLEIQKNDLIFWRNSKGNFEKLGSFISFYKELNLAFCFFEKSENDLSNPDSDFNLEKKDFLEKIKFENFSGNLYLKKDLEDYKIFQYVIIKFIP